MGVPRPSTARAGHWGGSRRNTVFLRITMADRARFVRGNRPPDRLPPRHCCGEHSMPDERDSGGHAEAGEHGSVGLGADG